MYYIFTILIICATIGILVIVAKYTIMSYLKTLSNLLAGKKAYLAGALMIVAGFLQADYSLALEGFAVIALRAGIKKLE